MNWFPGHRSWSFGRRFAAPFLLAAAFVAPAMAGPHDGRAKILLHAQPVTAKNACAAGAITDCGSAVTEGGVSSGSGPYYFVYVLGSPGSMSDLAGVQFGIDYQDSQPGSAGDLVGLDIYAWTNCATIDFPMPRWPDAGSGNTVTWDPINACQQGAAVAGYFYVGAYAPDSLRATIHPSVGVAMVASCSSAESPVFGPDLGFTVFSPSAAVAGCNPCHEDCPDFGHPRGPWPPPPPPGGYNPSILVHLVESSGPTTCAAGAITKLTDVKTNGDIGTDYYAYVIVAKENLRDVGGAAFGINYDEGDNGGVNILSWHLCADLEFPFRSPRWPGNNAGMLVTWDTVDNCQTGDFVIAGYFHVTAVSPDRFRLTQHPNSYRVGVIGCNSFEAYTPYERLGYADFSQGSVSPGCNPLVRDCVDPVPVTPTTWSRVKSLVREAGQIGRARASGQ